MATCYPNETKDFPTNISSLLLDNYGILSSDMRKTLVQNLVMLRNKDVITSIQYVLPSVSKYSDAERTDCRLLQTLFPLLPRTNSSVLRSSIRRTVLTDIRTANRKTKNHKLNKAVQAMLFSMVERGMSGEVLGDKGKVRVVELKSDTKLHDGEEAMWAIILTKELWKKGIWSVVS